MSKPVHVSKHARNLAPMPAAPANLGKPENFQGQAMSLGSPKEKPLTKKAQAQLEITEARNELKALWEKAIAQGNPTLYTKLDHRSSSGMLRVITPFLIIDGRPRNVSWFAEKILGWKRDENHQGGIRVAGAGMDMGYHLYDSLGSATFGYPDFSRMNYKEHSLKHEWL